MSIAINCPKSVGSSVRIAAAVFALALGLASTVPGLADERPVQSVKPAGVTVNYAQVLSWLGNDAFAVGRWDGTVSLFRVPKSNEFGPAILQAMSTPSGRGVEMLATINASSFVTSDGPDRLAVWRRKSTGTPFELAANLTYDAAFGSANSGLALNAKGNDYFVSGHEGGHVLIWHLEPDGNYRLHKVVDIRSPNPPSNPWGLHNVRGLAAWRGNRVISGSEDGDLVAIDISAGRELFRQRYNAKAQRGINSVSIVGESLAVANCAVGTTDKNIWLFDLTTDHPKLLDAENLALDTNRAQVFNFDVDLISVPSNADRQPILTFFSSTEEGLMWQGIIDGDQLVTTGVTRTSPEGAAVMAIAPNGDFVAAAAFAIRLFKAN